MLITVFTAWAGIVIGVSFVATPAKFLASSLSLAEALDVGRHTFRVLSRLDLSMAIVASALCWFTRAKLPTISGLAAIWLVIMVEQLWLLPLLDNRVTMHLAGSAPPMTYHRTLFIGLEAVKVVVLLTCAASGFAAQPGRQSKL